MRISVIIPIFNTPIDRVKRCVYSIIHGDFQNMEVLLIDDGSEQSNAEQYSELTYLDKRISYYPKTNEGPALARNFGISKANGEYVTFVDSDDFITPYCLEQADRVIKQYHPDLILGLVEKFDGDDNSALKYRESNDGSLVIVNDKENLINHILGYQHKRFIYSLGYIGDGPVARVFLRKLFNEFQFDDKSYWSEDTIWNMRLIKKCQNIIIVENVWYAYSIYDKSLTQAYRKDCFDEFVFRIEQEYNVMEKTWPEIKKGICVRIWHEIFILCRLLIFHPENTMSIRERYRLLKRAIKTDEYQHILHEIDFNYDRSIIKRIFKSFLRMTMTHRWYFITYGILRLRS